MRSEYARSLYARSEVFYWANFKKYPQSTVRHAVTAPDAMAQWCDLQHQYTNHVLQITTTPRTRVRAHMNLCMSQCTH